MKALKFLKHMKQTDTPYNFRECELDEAIAELESVMKNKTCKGCVYGMFGVDSFGLEIECTLAYKCSRGQDDMFKPKDNA